MSRSELLKTTVYLERTTYRQLKEIAHRKGTKPAALVREAVSQFTTRESESTLPRSLGLAASERGDLSEQDEELLTGFGETG